MKYSHVTCTRIPSRIDAPNDSAKRPQPIGPAGRLIDRERGDRVVRRMRPMSILQLLTMIVLVGAEAGFSQSNPPEETNAVHLEVPRSLAHAHVPDRFSVLPHRITNERTEPFEGICITTLEDRHDVQFGRRVFVPPNARLKTWQPVLLPDAPPSDPILPKTREVPFRTLLFDSAQTDEQIVRQESGSLQIRDTIWLAHTGQVTGILLPDRDEPRPSGLTIYNFAKTGRLEQSVPFNYVDLAEGLPPGGAESLAPFDHLVIANRSVLDDRSVVEAVRRWLFAGGHLWVMLDRTGAELLDVLLGDDLRWHLVDQVGLTRVDLEVGPGFPPNEEEPREFDHPVDLVRVLSADGFDIHYTTDGWPAALWKKCGEGRLLVTTLGAEAWVRPRLPSDPEPPRNPGLKTHFVPGPAFDDLMSVFFIPRAEPLQAQEALQTQASDYVGYTVPSRGLVVGLLSAFTLCLIGAGTWLVRTGEGQRLGVFGPVAALIASLSLMAVGRAHRSLPSMTAVTQFVQPIPGTDVVRSTGAAASFVEDSSDVAYSGTGGWLLPETSEEETRTRRVVWSGLDHWEWEQLPLTQGLHASKWWDSAELSERAEAVATFDNEGVVGHLSLPENLKATDAVLVTPLGRIGAEISGADRFRARARDLFSGSQYVAAGMLTDEQTNRGRTVASLIESADGQFPSEPVLMFWTEPWNLGTSFSSNESLRGSALVTLPVTFERPSAGATIRIPSPLVNYREGAGPDLEFPTGLFDHRTGLWMERTKAATAWLHFSLPAALEPVRLTSARITVRVTGPMRQLKLAGIRDGQIETIVVWRDPVGTLTHEIADGQLLTLSPDGTLMLKVVVGDADQPPSASNFGSSASESFRIESLALEVDADVLDGDAASTPLPND